MKTITKNVARLTLILAISTSFWACNDDKGYSVNNFGIGWGTASSKYGVDLDNGAKINVVSSIFPTDGFASGQRLIMDYTVLGDGTAPKSYNVRLNDYVSVLTKKPILQSFIDLNSAVREDSIGTNPIVVNDAWFSAGRYLNIDFGIKVGNTGVVHMINLVNDNTSVAPTRGDSVYLTLRQNAYTDPATFPAWGYVSFDVASIVPAGATSIPVKLIWRDYNGHTHFETGTFNLRGSNSSVVKNSRSSSDRTGKPIEVQ